MTPATPQPTPLSLPQYALKAQQTNRFEHSPEEFDNLSFGYFGEVGGLLAAVKKTVRDQLKEPQSGLLPDSQTPSLGVMMKLEVVHGYKKAVQS